MSRLSLQGGTLNKGWDPHTHKLLPRKHPCGGEVRNVLRKRVYPNPICLNSHHGCWVRFSYNMIACITCTRTAKSLDSCWILGRLMCVVVGNEFGHLFLRRPKVSGLNCGRLRLYAETNITHHLLIYIIYNI